MLSHLALLFIRSTYVYYEESRKQNGMLESFESKKWFLCLFNWTKGPSPAEMETEMLNNFRFFILGFVLILNLIASYFLHCPNATVRYSVSRDHTSYSFCAILLMILSFTLTFFYFSLECRFFFGSITQTSVLCKFAS